VTKLEDTGKKIIAHLEGKDIPEKMEFDRALMSVGRRPNSENLGLENTQVQIDQQGFVSIDEQCRTSDKRILAIGDVSGQPMLATERFARERSQPKFWPVVIPHSTTAPYQLWCSQSRKSLVRLTESEAKAAGREIGAAKFPVRFRARPYACRANRTDQGDLRSPDHVGPWRRNSRRPRRRFDRRSLPGYRDGAVLEDLLVTIHPHPTLSETIMEAAATAVSRLERQRKREAQKAKTSV